MGLGGFEPPTSPLSGVRSNQLSYRPGFAHTCLRFSQRRRTPAHEHQSVWTQQVTCVGTREKCRRGLLKEVIQPHVPVRLPCYDFTPITNPTLVTYLPRRGWPSAFASCRLSWCDGRCVQAPGTHSPHYADARLLATPPSCRRVAADNLY